MTVLFAGLIVWIITTILVESELTRPFREWIGTLYDEAATALAVVKAHPVTFRPKVRRRLRFYVSFLGKMRYLVGCHLCTGVWIGLLVALVLPGVRPFGTGFGDIVLAGLLFKAVAHIVLVLQKVGESLGNRTG